jgi:glycerol-3-phosphate dehydrogenase
VNMPITEQMYAVLQEGRAPSAAIRELMERRLTRE